MTRTIIDISHDFFDQVVKPILVRDFPQETAQTAFGVFGLGSEALKMDDQLSRDHHWGIRIDALMPTEIFNSRREAMLATLKAQLPRSFEGFELGEGLVAGAGIAPDTLPGFLLRTIGIDHAPASEEEWLNIPEEDITHVTNGEVWYDPDGTFSGIRNHLLGYYPEPVRLRRLAHWCRYYSGMGTYAVKRAMLRDNELYATLAFARSIRLGIQMAFMLDKRYYPYDKWLFAFFKKLPRMYGRMGGLVEAAIKLSTPWEEKLALLDQMSDQLDQAMVEDGIIKPHPKFVGSASSGYRLMEHAYKEILDGLSPSIRPMIPQWEQIYLEKFVVGYVTSIEMDAWHHALNLHPVE